MRFCVLELAPRVPGLNRPRGQRCRSCKLGSSYSFLAFGFIQFRFRDGIRRRQDVIVRELSDGLFERLAAVDDVTSSCQSFCQRLENVRVVRKEFGRKAIFAQSRFQLTFCFFQLRVQMRDMRRSAQDFHVFQNFRRGVYVFLRREFFRDRFVIFLVHMVRA